jgi:hypothetical protein
MIADPEWTLCRPWRSSSPVNALPKSVDRYRRMPPGPAFVAVSVVSLVLAVISGMLGGLAAMYLHDRGMSKGDDVAVFLRGLFAVGMHLRFSPYQAPEGASFGFFAHLAIRLLRLLGSPSQRHGASSEQRGSPLLAVRATRLAGNPAVWSDRGFCVPAMVAGSTRMNHRGVLPWNCLAR